MLEVVPIRGRSFRLSILAFCTHRSIGGIDSDLDTLPHQQESFPNLLIDSHFLLFVVRDLQSVLDTFSSSVLVPGVRLLPVFSDLLFYSTLEG